MGSEDGSGDSLWKVGVRRWSSSLASRVLTIKSPPCFWLHSKVCKSPNRFSLIGRKDWEQLFHGWGIRSVSGQSSWQGEGEFPFRIKPKSKLLPKRSVRCKRWRRGDLCDTGNGSRAKSFHDHTAIRLPFHYSQPAKELIRFDHHCLEVSQGRNLTLTNLSAHLGQVFLEIIMCVRPRELCLAEPLCFHNYTHN